MMCVKIGVEQLKYESKRERYMSGSENRTIKWSATKKKRCILDTYCACRRVRLLEVTDIVGC